MLQEYSSFHSPAQAKMDILTSASPGLERGRSQLGRQRERGAEKRGGLVEAKATVESENGLHVLLRQIEAGVVEVLGEPSRVVALRDDRDLALSCPSEEDLSRAWKQKR